MFNWGVCSVFRLVVGVCMCLLFINVCLFVGAFMCVCHTHTHTRTHKHTHTYGQTHTHTRMQAMYYLPCVIAI